MNVDFYVYNATTGKILWVGVCPQAQVADQAVLVGTAAGEGSVNPASDTINTVTGNPNPPPGTQVPATLTDLTMLANGADEALVENIPAGTVAVWFDASVTPIDDGELRVTSEYAGSFSCQLQLEGYTPRALTFVAS